MTLICQRCQNRSCRSYFATAALVCPRCGQQVPKGLKFLAFRKVIKGKRFFKSIGRKHMSDAERLHAAWLQEITAPPSSPPDQRTWKQVSDAYVAKLEAEGKRYAKTVRVFLDRMEQFWSLNGQAAREISPEMVEQFKTHLRSIGASPAYVDRHLQMAKAAWNYSLKALPNPFGVVALYKPDNQQLRFLTPDEEKKLLDTAKTFKHQHAPPRLYEIIAVAIYSGLRKRNVLDLHTDEVDFAQRMVRLRQKSNLRLEVPMSQIVHDVLKAIAPESGGWFFPNPVTGKPYEQIDKSWKALKKAAGINRPFRFHDLRHHFGTRLAAQTGNAFVVKELMGHKNMITSLRYVHPIMEQMRAAVENLANQAPQKAPHEEKPSDK